MRALACVLVLSFLLQGCAAHRSAAADPGFAALQADTLRERPIAPGIRHHYLWMARGPWAIHVVEADPGVCGVDLRTVKAGEQLVGRATTSELGRAAAERTGRPTLAAVNGDFFSFDPPGVPVGAQITAGEVVRGPGERPVFGVDAERRPFIGVLELEAELRTPLEMVAPLSEVNTPPAEDGLTLYNRFIGPTTPLDSGVVELRVEGAAPDHEGWTHGLAAGLDTLPTGVAPPAGGVIIAGRGRGAAFLRHLVVPGDSLRWRLGFDSHAQPLQEAIGGHPRLLRAGRIAPQLAAAPRSFGEARHPRTAVGWRADGTLLLVTVDGRQPGYSAGMSLQELAALFLSLGATEALNLDGGGSTTMIAGGVVANRPSDGTGERRVANALVLLGPAPGVCDHSGSP